MLPYDTQDGKDGKLWQVIKAAVDKTRSRASKFAAAAEWAFGKKTARVLGVLGVVGLFAVVVILMFVFLHLYIVASGNKAGARKDVILTTAQILGGIALLSGFYFTWRTLQVNREGQITDRFTRAIAQLGDQQLEAQLGGIYALERIARDSPARDYNTVMEVLTAYVRRHSSATDQDQGAEQGEKPTYGTPRPDNIQAVLAVLKRREVEHIPEEDRLRLDLQGTDLRGALLPKSHFQKVLLRGANLQGADLRDADLQRANLLEANLQGANLQGANLQGAHGMTQDQIEWTIGSNKTEPPEYLNRPELWRKSCEEQVKMIINHLGGGEEQVKIIIEEQVKIIIDHLCGD